MKAKILAIDIETSPLLVYTWGLYEQDAIKKVRGFTILSVAYQWLGERTEVIACDTQSEKALLIRLHKLLDSADIVIAHNGDSFDVKKINARMIVHKIRPYSPFKTVDTKKVAKSVAAFDSNSLNNLGLDMDEGEKIKHRGFDMWEGCMAGKRRDWADMKRYNKKDVDLLVRIYKRLRPWIKNHPHTGLMAGNPGACPNCASLNVRPHGTRFTKARVIQRYECVDCGAWS